MKKTKKQVTLGVIAAITAISTPIITAVSCGATDTSKNKSKRNIVTDKSFEEKIATYEKITKKHDDDSKPVIDKSKINMVSLGDSVAAGFTILDKKDHRGFMDKKGNVLGESYGSYIARAFKSKNKLEDYNNFAIAGSTTETLRNLIDPKFPLSSEGLSTKKTISNLVQGNEKERFKHVQDKIKKANLVTISIGANDILPNLKLGGKTIMELMSSGFKNLNTDLSNGINSLISYDENKLNKAIQGAILNLEATVASIKESNPKAKIVIVGYPMPLAQLASLLRLVKDEKGKSVADKILQSTDKVGRSLSKKYKTVDYVDGYIKSVWDINALELAPELMDIHPGIKGYKMMAATILANLSQSKSHADLVDDKTNNVRKMFMPTIAPKRLGEDYSKNITNFSNVKAPLNKEESKIQTNIKPWKLLHTITSFIPKVIGQIDGLVAGLGNNSATPLSSMYVAQSKTSSYGLMEKAQEYIPMISGFLSLVFESAEYGLKSGDQKVIDGVKQDFNFIVGTIADKTFDLEPKLLGTANADGSLFLTIIGMLIAPVLQNPSKGFVEVPKLFKQYIDTSSGNPKAKDRAFYKKLIAKGPSKIY